MSIIERRLISEAANDLHIMQAMIENVAAGVLALRPVIGSTLLALGRIEAIRAEQAHINTKRDDLLANAENRLIEVVAQSSLELGEQCHIIDILNKHIVGLAQQAERAANTKEARPDCDDPDDIDSEFLPEAGTDYVDVHYILASSGMGRRTFYEKIRDGVFPSHEAEQYRKGNLVHLWTRETIDPAIAAFRSSTKGKGRRTTL